jgi:hypothetical protein
VRIVGGDTIEVLRSDGADRFGDQTFTSVGTIDHVIIQWASASSAALRFQTPNAFQETSKISAVIFVPRYAAIQLEARDRIKLKNRLFQVVGDQEWNENHPITGTSYSHYMMQVEMVS